MTNLESIYILAPSTPILQKVGTHHNSTKPKSFGSKILYDLVKTNIIDCTKHTTICQQAGPNITLFCIIAKTAK